VENEVARCPICDWPMADSAKEGCVPGSCSYRPAEGSAEWERIKALRREMEAKKEPVQNG
jgi:hypothetical protein